MIRHPQDRRERLRLKELHEKKKDGAHASKVRRKLREALAIQETDLELENIIHGPGEKTSI